MVPVGVVLVSALPAVSWMSCPAAKPNVTVALRLARSPPETVTSNTVLAVTVATLVTVAVVPETVKSAAFTFCTFSSNVTRHVRLSALVGEVAGFWRMIEATRGAVT